MKPLYRSTLFFPIVLLFSLFVIGCSNSDTSGSLDEVDEPNIQSSAPMGNEDWSAPQRNRAYTPGFPTQETTSDNPSPGTDIEELNEGTNPTSEEESLEDESGLEEDESGLEEESGLEGDEEDPIEEGAAYDCTTGEEQECKTSCGTTGIQVCAKTWGPCNPPEETCDGVDEDCNGIIDDLADGEICATPCDETVGTWNPDPDCPKLGQELCADVLNESAYCLTGAGPNQLFATHLAYVGLDTGTVCPFMPIEEAEKYSSHSIAWLGDWMYACGWINTYGDVRGMNLHTGETAEFDIPCSAVTSYKGGLLVLLPPNPGYNTLHFYENEAALETGAFDVYSFPLHASRISTQGNTLVAAWHSAPTLDRHELPNGGNMGSIGLNGFSTWVWGLSLTEDGRVAWINSDQLIVFNESDGSEQKVFPFQDDLELIGLECVTNP